MFKSITDILKKYWKKIAGFLAALLLIFGILDYLIKWHILKGLAMFFELISGPEIFVLHKIYQYIQQNSAISILLLLLFCHYLYVERLFNHFSDDLKKNPKKQTT